MSPTFRNPVKVHFGCGTLARIPAILAGRGAYVITSRGVVRRGIVARLACRIEGVYDAVEPNPTIAAVTATAREIRAASPALLLAVGGGSVLDTAKAVAAQLDSRLEGDWLARHLRHGAPIPEDLRPAGLIAVPTTAGTGSEVTMWATIWDEAVRRKHSLAHPALYAEAAVVDPELTSTAAGELTLTTAMDALSHAMEAVWNRNANPVSDALAERSIRNIVRSLPCCLEALADLRWRQALHAASLVAGLAFSNTRTALAHSISYPLTAELGVPHGLACSFTLPEILTLNGTRDPERVEPIVSALGGHAVADAVETLCGFFKRVGYGAALRRYVPDPVALDGIHGTFATPGRADNNIVPVDDAAARKIAVQALERGARLT